MAEKKVTTMVLKVDLQCSRCDKKVKKVLCKYRQIRDQTYDKEANTVTITVVCCSPEKIRDKIRSEGGKSITSIEIKPPPKPKEPEKKPEKPKEEPKETIKKKPNDPAEKVKDPEKKSETKASQKPEAPAPPPHMAYPPIGFYPTEFYHGHGGGPYYFGGPPPTSGPCYGWPVYDSWGGDGGGYQHYYASDGNPQGCSIM